MSTCAPVAVSYYTAITSNVLGWESEFSCVPQSGPCRHMCHTCPCDCIRRPSRRSCFTEESGGSFLILSGVKCLGLPLEGTVVSSETEDELGLSTAQSGGVCEADVPLKWLNELLWCKLFMMEWTVLRSSAIKCFCDKGVRESDTASCQEIVSRELPLFCSVWHWTALLSKPH